MIFELSSASTYETIHRLDEVRAKALSEAFSDMLAPTIRHFAEALEIDTKQAFGDQAVAFFHKYHLLDPARKILEHFLVRSQNPNVSFASWVRVANILEKVGPDGQADQWTPADIRFLFERNILAGDLLKAWKLYPNSDADTVVLQLYNGALERE